MPSYIKKLALNPRRRILFESSLVLLQAKIEVVILAELGFYFLSSQL